MGAALSKREELVSCGFSDSEANSASDGSATPLLSDFESDDVSSSNHADPKANPIERVAEAVVFLVKDVAGAPSALDELGDSLEARIVVNNEIFTLVSEFMSNDAFDTLGTPTNGVGEYTITLSKMENESKIKQEKKRHNGSVLLQLISHHLAGNNNPSTDKNKRLFQLICDHFDKYLTTETLVTNHPPLSKQESEDLGMKCIVSHGKV
ncbi:hypothetical protein F53441_12942 [Fusarium austroafricanum]|uniref:Uncharacterized protein n=1 Tax=Fusarium austroafricanum TaxID=2364996 RepID=A0A8H4JTE1_9HYPO|nr:hypothetical protein F53441_12942 [Fusarium austroafricanum]